MTLENIIFAVLFLFILSLATVGFILMAKYLVIYPLSCYYTKRRANRLQWKAIETADSRQAKASGIQDFIQDCSFINEFELEWRILPSELPYIIRVYGYNDWKSFKGCWKFKFNNEQEFKDYVSKFKTLNDLNRYYDKVENKTVWYEP